MNNKTTSPEELKEKINSFGELLNSIENLEGKKKYLWKEIYENAVVDRMNAYMMFTDVYTTMSAGISDHVQLGSIMAKYLERMNKANDQLIKLADLIASEEEKNSKLDPDDLFSQISEK
tara:strand:- start:2506 stop:2862 length:357 start_codon:yes stop_codon:yes gene_type:complete